MIKQQLCLARLKEQNVKKMLEGMLKIDGRSIDLGGAKPLDCKSHRQPPPFPSPRTPLPLADAGNTTSFAPRVGALSVIRRALGSRRVG